MRAFFSTFIAAAMLILLHGQAHAAMEDGTRFEVKREIPRLALVVGVQNYRQHAQVPNAINDAQAIGQALERTQKFSLIRVLGDPETSEDILAALDEVVYQAGEGAATIIFYFAGHGFHANDANYLLPRGAAAPIRKPRGTDKGPMIQSSLNIESIAARLGKRIAGVNILFIDACRTTLTGVSAVDPELEPPGFLKLATNPQSSMISFSTGYTDTAESYSPQTPYNSPYAFVLSDYMNKPALPLREILDKVHSKVGQATGHQKPELLNDAAAGTYFYFVPTKSEEDRELAMWRKARAKRTNNCISDYQHHFTDGTLVQHVPAYLEAYPLPTRPAEEELCDLQE